MTRVLSALVLLAVVIGTIWFLPPWGTLLLTLIAAVLAFSEYCGIARALGVWVPGGIGGVAVVLVCYAMATGGMLSDQTSMRGDPVFLLNLVPLVLISALIVVGSVSVARGRPGPGVLADAAATLFAPLYIGLPLGALVWVRGDWWFGGGIRNWDGRSAVLLLLVVIVVSDSAQYYTGRAFGRHALSPAISPKKTVEGAIGGLAFGTLAMTIGGRYLFASPHWMLALLGAAISLLKRSAGVKDSSNLIPGHGGVLDRIDSWLFAAPVYYVFVRFIA